MSSAVARLADRKVGRGIEEAPEVFFPQAPQNGHEVLIRTGRTKKHEPNCPAGTGISGLPPTSCEYAGEV